MNALLTGFLKEMPIPNLPEREDYGEQVPEVRGKPVPWPIDGGRAGGFPTGSLQSVCGIRPRSVPYG
jgi:hypothetical protein